MATVMHLHASTLWGSKISTCTSSSVNCRKNAGFRIEARKQMEGKVVKAVNDKTLAVEVVRLVLDMKNRKRVRRTKKYQVHDPDNFCLVGDVVGLEHCPPKSKTKRFQVCEVKRNGILIAKKTETIEMEQKMAAEAAAAELNAKTATSEATIETAEAAGDELVDAIAPEAATTTAAAAAAEVDVSLQSETIVDEERVETEEKPSS